MQIGHGGLDRLLRILQGPERVDRPGRPEVARRAGTAGPTDRVTISSEGRELQVLWQRVAEAPDVRAAKVAELRQAVQAGQYRVTGEEIAARMLQGFGDRP